MIRKRPVVPVDDVAPGTSTDERFSSKRLREAQCVDE